MLLLAGTFTVAHAEEDPLGRHGGHPLAGRNASLEDLLNQADWQQSPPLRRPAVQAFPDRGGVAESANDGLSEAEPSLPVRPYERPLAEQPPSQVVTTSGAIRSLQDAISERNQIVDKVSLFDTIDEIVKEEAELRRCRDVLNTALARQKQAADRADQLNHPGATLVAPAVKAEARRVWENARAASNQANAACLNQANKLQPLYDRVRPEIGPWLACYGRMRRAIRPDRRDPDRQSMIRVLEGAVRERRDFLEGRVLAALLSTYEGDAGAAEAHLRQACADMARHNLFGTPFAGDGCYAYLLLGRPDMVRDFVDVLRKLQPQRQTAFQCWLVGLSAMMTCRDGEAATYMQRALAKIDFHKPGHDVSPEDLPLLGDAALFRVTASSEAQRDVDKARQILARTKPEWDAWQLLRARAALAAAEENWDAALQQLDRCVAACPPTLAEEVQAQRSAYAAGDQWIRPRPGAASITRQ